MEPAGEITVVAPGTPPALVQRDGVNYTITGTLTGQEEDSLFLATVPPLRIALDTATRAKLPEIQPGDSLSLRGVIEVDLPDEW